MKKIYEVGGILNKGFVGQIAYSVCLDRPYQEMTLSFSFDKQYYDSITEELKKELVAECHGQYNADSATDEMITEALRSMKTELQIIVTMNDEFIGGVHRQDNPKIIQFSKTHATEGCMPQASICGVIRVTVVAFSVIQDDTHYKLSLSVH